MDNDNEFLETKGKGAIKDTKDKRDLLYSDVAMSLPPFDWSKGYDVEQIIGKKLTIKDQNGSSSCGGQAWATLGEALDPDNEEKSSKFIYAFTYVGNGGSAGRTNCERVINVGWGDEDKTPSYENGQPPSESFMERKSDITSLATEHAKIDKGLSYAMVNLNIDEVAQAISNNKGCIIGIYGTNNGTWRTKFPLPPKKIDPSVWAHWVYCGKALMINGKKYIGFANSWGISTGEQGWQYISEDYFKGGVWSCWTMVYNFPKFKFNRDMKIGSTLSPDVKELQKKLGVIQTGLFWTLTRNAVVKYQKTHNLVPDGIVGPKTRAVLNS